VATGGGDEFSNLQRERQEHEALLAESARLLAEMQALMDRAKVIQERRNKFWLLPLFGFLGATEPDVRLPLSSMEQRQ
jgi:hypothetical protein